MLSQTLLKYCSLFLHNFDRNSIRIFLESSPEYPSLLSVIKTLQYARLDVQSGKCEWNYLQNLKSPFLLHIKLRSTGTIVICNWDNKDNSIHMFNPKRNKWEVKDKEDLDKIWDGVVIYTQAKPIKKSFTKSNVIFAIGAIVVFFFLFSCFKSEDISIFYVTPLIIGLIISITLYWQTFMPKIDIVEKLCHISTITDCEIVENSSYSSIMGIKMGCMSLSFFTSQLFCIGIAGLFNISNAFYSIYSISSIIIIPTVLYSAYGQFKLKKACPLCILIITCILFESIISITFPIHLINLNLVLLWCCIESCVLFIMHHLHKLYSQQHEQLTEKIQLIRLKRRKEIMLLESAKVGTVLSPIWIGSEKSPVSITTFISLSCKHCRKVSHDIFSLMDKGLEFRWNIIFRNASGSDVERIDNWIKQYYIDKDKFLSDLQLWSKASIGAVHVSKFPSTEAVENIDSNKIKQFFEKQLHRLNVHEFPTIIFKDNLLSSIYSVSDIELLMINHHDYNDVIL